MLAINNQGRKKIPLWKDGLGKPVIFTCAMPCSKGYFSGQIFHVLVENVFAF